MAQDTSAAETAYALLKGRLLSGELPDGVMISEGSVAADLGVSRTPVREAFLRLEAQGWLRLYPKRGALVLPADAAEFAEVLDARRLVESHAVTVIADDEAARSRLATELRRILDIQRAHAEADDPQGFLVADADFHGAVMRAGRNRFLTDLAESLRDRQQRMTSRSVRTPETMAPVVTEHEGLIEAIASGDADAFRSLLDAHLHRTHH